MACPACATCLSRPATVAGDGHHCDALCQRLHSLEALDTHVPTMFAGRKRKIPDASESLDSSSSSALSDDEEDREEGESESSEEPPPPSKKQRTIIINELVRPSAELPDEILKEILKLIPLPPQSLFQRLLKLREVATWMSALVYSTIYQLDLLRTLFPNSIQPQFVGDVEIFIETLMTRVHLFAKRFMHFGGTPHTEKRPDWYAMRPFYEIVWTKTGGTKVVGAWNTHARRQGATLFLYFLSGSQYFMLPYQTMFEFDLRHDMPKKDRERITRRFVFESFLATQDATLEMYVFVNDGPEIYSHQFPEGVESEPYFEGTLQVRWDAFHTAEIRLEL